MNAPDTLAGRIEESLDTVRPYLRADGGDVQFLRFRENGTVELQWIGTCLTCPMSAMTLRAGLERALMRDIPEIRRVEAVAP
ncbi:MAG TPA: NifU family protein [Bacteroidota bacterium]|nr:NifU family protein [Bacteroidota bacterium]